MEFQNTIIADRINHTVFNNISLNDDCCKTEALKDDPSNLCFRSLQSMPDNLATRDDFSLCIPARESLNKSPAYCSLTIKDQTLKEDSSPLGNNHCSTFKKSDESHSFHCMSPSTDSLLQIKRKEYNEEVGRIQNLDSDFLFVGNPVQVYEDVIISNYIPR